MSYHVRCAIGEGIIQRWDLMRKDLPELKYDDPTPVFCRAHRAKGIKLFKENLNEKKLCKKTKKDRVSSRAKDLNLTEQPIPKTTPILEKTGKKWLRM